MLITNSDSFKQFCTLPSIIKGGSRWHSSRRRRNKMHVRVASSLTNKSGEQNNERAHKNALGDQNEQRKAWPASCEL